MELDGTGTALPELIACPEPATGTAAGPDRVRRSLGFIEDAVRDRVLPRYANTHTESSGTGRVVFMGPGGR